MFSRRTEWEASANELAEILYARRAAGLRVIDLTVSNPTACGFPYPDDRILRALSSPVSLTYSPDPRGLLSAREAVAGYYRRRGLAVGVEDIFITASTSESYSLLFKLLCDPGDAVLVPRPSYPLFEYLAGINDVRTIPYRLACDGRWDIDTASVRDGLAQSARAVVVVDPHNPTGSFVPGGTWEEIRLAASRRGAPLIVDEVFRDYDFGGAGKSSPESGTRTPNHGVTAEGGGGNPGRGTQPLTFLLTGVSKTAALPQMKVGWIVVAGDGPEAAEATSRLEILNDTYLSANTPAQAALPELLAAGESVRPLILERLSGNDQTLRGILKDVPGCSILHAGGGWNAVVGLPDGLSDAECALGVLRREGVYCYPGFFFDFDENNVIILSLLAPLEEFAEGVRLLGKWIDDRSGIVSR
jgi:alanine-synthesizing transaminase